MSGTCLTHTTIFTERPLSRGARRGGGPAARPARRPRPARARRRAPGEGYPPPGDRPSTPPTRHPLTATRVPDAVHGGFTRVGGLAVPQNARVTSAPPAPTYRPTPPLGVHLAGDGVDVAVLAARATGVDLCLLDRDDASATGWHERRVRARRPGARRLVRARRRASTRASTTASGRTAPWDPARGLRHNPAKLLVDPYARGLSGALALRPGDVRARRRRAAGRWRPRRPRGHARLASGRSRTPSSSTPATAASGSPARSAVGGDRRLRGARPRPDEAPARRPGGPARHLRGPRPPRDRRPPARRSASRPSSCCRCTPSPPSRTSSTKGLTNYWGYNTLGFFAPHADVRDPVRAVRRRRRRARRAQGRRPAAARGRARGRARRRLQPHLRGRRRRAARLAGAAWTPRGYYLHDGGLPARFADVTGLRQLPRLPPPARRPDGAGLAAVLGRGGRRRRLPVRPRGDPRPGRRRLRPRPPVPRRPADRPGAAAGQAHRRAVGHRPGRVADRQLPAADGRVERPVPQRASARSGSPTPRRPRTAAPGTACADLATRLAGSVDLFGHGDPPLARGPVASVNYVTAHDGFCMADLVAYEHKHNEANGEQGRDGSDDNRSWNHGVEGPVRADSPARRHPAAAPPVHPQPHGDAAARRRHADDHRPATRSAAPSAATTTPTARTPRCPGSAGSCRTGGATCSRRRATCCCCAARTPRCGRRRSSAAAPPRRAAGRTSPGTTSPPAPSTTTTGTTPPSGRCRCCARGHGSTVLLVVNGALDPVPVVLADDRPDALGARVGQRVGAPGRALVGRDRRRAAPGRRRHRRPRAAVDAPVPRALTPGRPARSLAGSARVRHQPEVGDGRQPGCRGTIRTV